MRLTIKFINYWSGVELSVKGMRNAVPGLVGMFDDAGCVLRDPVPGDIVDIAVGSVFGDPRDIVNFPARVHVLHTQECLAHGHFKTVRQLLFDFDLVVGLVVDSGNMHHIPYEVFKSPLGGIGPVSLEEVASMAAGVSVARLRERDCCLVSTNPHPLRLALLKALRASEVRVDCPSKVGCNMPNGIKGGRAGKLEFMSNYNFTICPENIVCPGYLTEKLMDACLAGTIPVYSGPRSLEDGFFNFERIVWADGKNGVSRAVEEVQYLLRDSTALKQRLTLPPFASGALERIAEWRRNAAGLAGGIAALTLERRKVK